MYLYIYMPKFNLKTQLIIQEQNLRHIQEIHQLSNIISQLQILKKCKSPGFSLSQEFLPPLGGKVLWNTYITKTDDEQIHQLIQDTLQEISRSVSLLSWADGGIKEQHRNIPWDGLELIGSIAESSHEFNYIYNIAKDRLLMDIDELNQKLEYIQKRETFKLQFNSNSIFLGEEVERLFITPLNKKIAQDKDYKNGELFPITENIHKNVDGLQAVHSISQFLNILVYLEKINQAVSFLDYIALVSMKDHLAVLGILQEIGEFSKHLPSSVTAKLPDLAILKTIRDKLGHELLDSIKGIATLQELIKKGDLFTDIKNKLSKFFIDVQTVYDNYKALYAELKTLYENDKIDKAQDLFYQLSNLHQGTAALRDKRGESIETVFEFIKLHNLSTMKESKILSNILIGNIPSPNTKDEYMLFLDNIRKFIVDPIIERLKGDPVAVKQIGVFNKELNKALACDFEKITNPNVASSSASTFQFILDEIDNIKRTLPDVEVYRSIAQLNSFQDAVRLIVQYTDEHLREANLGSIEEIRGSLLTDKVLLCATRYLATIIGENIRNLEQDAYFVQFTLPALRVEFEALKWLRNSIMHSNEGKKYVDSLLYFFKHSVLQESQLNEGSTVFYFSLYINTLSSEITHIKDRINEARLKGEENAVDEILRAQEAHIAFKMKDNLRKIFEKYGYNQYWWLDPTLTEADFNTVYFILKQYYKIALPDLQFDSRAQHDTCDSWNILVGHVKTILEIKDKVNWITLEETKDELLKITASYTFSIKGIFGRLFGDRDFKDKLAIVIESFPKDAFVKYSYFKQEIYKLYGYHALVITQEELEATGHGNIQIYPIQATLNTRGLAQSLSEQSDDEDIEELDERRVDQITTKLKDSIDAREIIINMPINYFEGILEDMPRGTLLHMAIHSAQLEFAAVLLNLGANPNIQDSRGQTALHYAAEKDIAVMVRYLLEKGADPNIADHSKRTPYALASYLEHTKSAKELKQHTILDLEDRWKYAIQSKDTEEVNHLIKSNLIHSLSVKDGQAPIHIATSRGDLEITQLLLAAGALINQEDIDGNTPLYLSLHEAANIELATLLLKQGADPRIRNNEGDTPYHAYAILHFTDEPLLFKMLITGANINEENLSKDTPLYTSLLGNVNPHNVGLLIQHGADSSKIKVESGIDKEIIKDLIIYQNNYYSKNFNFLQSNKIAFLFLTAKETLENAVAIKYLFTDIINPVIPQYIENIELPDFFKNNWVWGITHLLVSLTAALTFPGNDITIQQKIVFPTLSSLIYTTKIFLYDYLQEYRFKKLSENPEPANTTFDSLLKCGPEILLQGALGGISTKVFWPKLWLEQVLKLDIVNNAIIGGLQCYTSYKPLSEEKSHLAVIVPYITDLAYIACVGYSGMTSSLSFANFYTSALTMKKVFGFISGLALVDSLSKIVMDIISKDYSTPDDTIIQTHNS